MTLKFPKKASLQDFSQNGPKSSKNGQIDQFWWGNVFWYPFPKFPHRIRQSPSQIHTNWIEKIGKIHFLTIFRDFGLLDPNFGRPRGSGRNFWPGMVGKCKMCPMDPRNRKNNHMEGLEWFSGTFSFWKAKMSICGPILRAHFSKIRPKRWWNLFCNQKIIFERSTTLQFWQNPESRWLLRNSLCAEIFKIFTSKFV